MDLLKKEIEAQQSAGLDTLAGARKSEAERAEVVDAEWKRGTGELAGKSRRALALTQTEKSTQFLLTQFELVR